MMPTMAPPNPTKPSSAEFAKIKGVIAKIMGEIPLD
jgi:hypothetical protein